MAKTHRSWMQEHALTTTRAQTAMGFAGGMLFANAFLGAFKVNTQTGKVPPEDKPDNGDTDRV